MTAPFVAQLVKANQGKSLATREREICWAIARLKSRPFRQVTCSALTREELMPMKRGARPATSRRQLALAIPGARGCEASPVSALPAPPRDELVSLLQRLHDELEEFLNDLGVSREPSRNRESSRQT
jgi:hypothetical protein